MTTKCCFFTLTFLKSVYFPAIDYQMKIWNFYWACICTVLRSACVTAYDWDVKDPCVTVMYCNTSLRPWTELSFSVTDSCSCSLIQMGWWFWMILKEPSRAFRLWIALKNVISRLSICCVCLWGMSQYWLLSCVNTNACLFLSVLDIIRQDECCGTFGA